MDFDRYKDSYRAEVDRAVAFAGADTDFYTESKADALVDLARRSVGPPDQLSVLDAGCGPGETDRFLRDRFGQLTGADVSQEMVEVAAERNPWASYRRIEAGEPLPFDDESFELTFAICVLHHIDPPDRAAFVAELGRVTKPAGIVAIFEHNPINPATRKVVRDCPFDEGVTLLRMSETTGLLNRGPLSPVERRFILFIPRPGGILRRIEHGLARVPLGAQYYVAARRAPASAQPPHGYG